jgi:fructose-bisphosphate aldolase class II
MNQIKKAVEVGGVRKINIDTDLRLAITSTFRKYFHDNPGIEQGRPYLTSIKGILDGTIPGIDPKSKKPVEPGKIIDPRVYLAEIPKEVLREHPKGTELEEVMAIIKERIAKHVEMLVHEFGSAGLSEKVDKKLTLEKMAKKYKIKK